MKRWLRTPVSGLWLAALPPLALWLLEPVRMGTSLSGLSGNALSTSESLALSAYLSAYLCSGLGTPTLLLSWLLQRALRRWLPSRLVE